MPNRVLRDWTDSETINSLSCEAERFFTRLIMRVDDYGRISANPRYLRSQLFPLMVESFTIEQMETWLGELQRAMIVKPDYTVPLITLYAVSDKRYLQINEFDQRKRIKSSKIPDPAELITMPHVAGFLATNGQTDDGQITPHTVVQSLLLDVPPIQAPERRRPQADPEAELKKQYEELSKAFENATEKDKWAAIKAFIQSAQPRFIEPYYDGWNVFASFYNLPQMTTIGKARAAKFKTRITDKDFDFIGILKKIQESDHLKGGNTRTWMATFDWIIENDGNFRKILDGNFK